MEIVARNKKANFQYEIIERFEAGIALTGTEVKSLRNRNVSINESYARLQGDEIYLYGMNINPYGQGNRLNHEPTRVRKLLLHRREINRLIGKIQTKGLTIIPLAIYFNKRGLAKLGLCVAKGKRMVDKREKIKKETIERDLRRAVLKKLE